MSDNSIFSEQTINLTPARDQWRRAAALALDISRSNNIYLHRESVRIAQDILTRIRGLVEAAAKADRS